MGRLSKLIGLLEKPQRAALGRFALICLFSPVVDLISVSMMIPVIQQAFQQEPSGEIIGRIVFLALLLLLVGLFELIRGRFSTALVMDISHGWSVKLYDLYGMEELEDHNRKTPMQAIAGARTDPAVCAEMIPSCLRLVTDFLLTLAYAAAMIYVARGIGAASCAAMLVLMAALYCYSRLRVSWYGEKKRKLEIRAGGLVSTMFGAYKEIKIDSRRENLLEKYRKASADCAQMQKDYEFIRGIQGIVLQNVMQSALFLSLAGVFALEVDLPYLLSGAVIYVTLLIRMLPTAKRIVDGLTSLQYASKYYETLCSDLERYTVLLQAKEDRMRLREKCVTLNQGIRVENLSFHYPNGKQVLEGVSMEIPAGCSMAVVGASAAGKTTLLDLILGLLHPQSGHIWYDDFDLVDGKDSQGECRGDVGKVVSYIPQTVYLNGETVRENVIFMADEDDQGEERVIECLRYAQIWEDVRELPDGLDTVIGQNGTAISGGQRQRIALARALYKKSEILIMDEATAALDLDTERAVIDSIRQMKGQKTLLLVTHHLGLANECEHIYRLENRKLIKVR